MELGVNIDHIATLRNARGGIEPSVLEAAKICERCGASSITVHLREDRRHIKDDDVRIISKTVSTNINLEMAVTDEMGKIALEVLPHSVWLVPEKRQEVTTEGGLDVAGQVSKMEAFIGPLKAKGILVSLFIDPDDAQVRASAAVGADFIELHTGSFAHAFGDPKGKVELDKLKAAAKLAQSLGLKVNAGHGLNYENVLKMHEIEGLIELNIGHSIISRAVFTGLEEAVLKMKELIS